MLTPRREPISPGGGYGLNPSAPTALTFYLSATGVNASAVIGETYSVSCYGYSGDTASCPSTVTMTSTDQSSVATIDSSGYAYANVMVNVQIGASADQVVSTDVNFY